jgi:hypothetical protein
VILLRSVQQAQNDGLAGAKVNGGWMNLKSTSLTSTAGAWAKFCADEGTMTPIARAEPNIVLLRYVRRQRYRRSELG